MTMKEFKNKLFQKLEMYNNDDEIKEFHMTIDDGYDIAHFCIDDLIDL